MKPVNQSVNDAVNCRSDGEASPDREMLATLTALEPFSISLDTGGDLIGSPQSNDLLDKYRRDYLEMRSAMEA